jgi:glutamate racemase
VTLIDTGAAVARQVRRVADEINFLLTRNVRESFWTSGDASRQSPIVAKLWGKPVSMADLPHEVAMRH